MNQIQQVQAHLKKTGLDGWLLYDFQGSNRLARQFLALPASLMSTRRFFYWIPARGEPMKLVHAIESKMLDSLPGEKTIYSSWQSLEEGIGAALRGAKKIAMEYSFKNRIPYISLVDGGTIDLIRSFGVEVESSADFLLCFTALLSLSQMESQRRAGSLLDQITAAVWKWIAEELKEGKGISEFDVQQKIVAAFESNHLIADHDPIVAVNAHSADPHYQPVRENSASIEKGDFLLIDLWAKEKEEGAIYADITRVAVAAAEPTAHQKKIFHLVRQAQQAAVDLIESRFAENQRVEGWEVDEAAREVIRRGGYGPHFIHRTGHNIGTDLHGRGVHIDNLEMHDTRPLLPNTSFSIEPGIYLEGQFGIRLEFDVLIREDRQIEIIGGKQDRIHCLF